MKNNSEYRIPLNTYFKECGFSGERRKNKRKMLKEFDAIVKEGTKQYLSLTRYADGKMEHLDRVGKRALTSDAFHVLEFYSNLSQDMLFEWIILVKLFIDTMPDSKKSLSIANLQQVFDRILEQRIAISKHTASANKLLFKLVYITPNKSDSPTDTKNGK